MQFSIAGCPRSRFWDLGYHELTPQSETVEEDTVCSEWGLRMRKKRFYTAEFRRLAVARMKGCRNVVALAEELDVPRRLLYRWRARLEGMVAPIAPRYPGLEEENRQLKQLLAERTLEVDFFKGALQKIQARRQADGGTGETASTTRCGQ